MDTAAERSEEDHRVTQDSLNDSTKRQGHSVSVLHVMLRNFHIQSLLYQFTHLLLLSAGIAVTYVCVTETGCKCAQML
jgi:hypothetical protein